MDARLPEKYLTDYRVHTLSDAAWRAYTYSLMWTMSQLSDGKVPKGALMLLHPRAAEGNTQNLADLLVGAGLWSATDDGWRIVDFDEFQTKKEVFDKKKEGARTRQQRFRERKTGVAAGSESSPAVTPGGNALREDRTGRKAGRQEVPANPATYIGKQPDQSVGVCNLCSHREPLAPNGVCVDQVTCARMRGSHEH